MGTGSTGSVAVIQTVDLRSSSMADPVQVAPQTSDASLIPRDIASCCSINADVAVVVNWPARPTLTSAPTPPVISSPTLSYCVSTKAFGGGPSWVFLGGAHSV